MNHIIEAMAQAWRNEYEAWEIVGGGACGGAYAKKGAIMHKFPTLRACGEFLDGEAMRAAIRAAMECESTNTMEHVYYQDRYTAKSDWGLAARDLWRALLGAMLEEST